MLARVFFAVFFADADYFSNISFLYSFKLVMIFFEKFDIFICKEKKRERKRKRAEKEKNTHEERERNLSRREREGERETARERFKRRMTEWVPHRVYVCALAQEGNSTREYIHSLFPFP